MDEMLKSVEKLERELNEANELNDHTCNQMSIGKDFLVQRTIELLEIEHQLEDTNNLSVELCELLMD